MRGVKRSCFRYEAVLPFLDTGIPAAAYFIQRDLTDEESSPVRGLWELPEPHPHLEKIDAGRLLALCRVFKRLHGC
jgi:hypothetical protein